MAYQDVLKEEVEELRKRGHQFLTGEISRGDLKGFSGGLGSYAQKEEGKFMIRLKTPSGIVSKEHLQLILSYAKENSLDKIHLTTRQAIQLHDLSIDAVCDIMRDGIDHDLFTRGGGGNFPRNVALSPMAGVDPGEVFDVTPFAILAGQYFLERATTYKLPRKLKVAFSSTSEDTACATINDMGFVAVMKDGKPYFQLYLAGGMGGAPAISIPYPELVQPEKVLYYIEAMVCLFKAEGNYENKAQARTRFIPRRMGVEAFLTCFEKHLKEVEENTKLEERKAELVHTTQWNAKIEIPDVVLKQRQKDYYTLVIHPICGQLELSDAQMIEKFLADKEKVDLRLSMGEDIYVRNLSFDEVIALMEETKNFNLLDHAGKTITCVGVPSCQMGIIQSQNLTHAIIEAMEEAELEEDYLPIIQVNGCQNSCSRHPVAALGFAGRKKKVEGESQECFDLYIGGKVGEDAALATLVGSMLAKRIPEYLVRLARSIQEEGSSYEEYCESGAFEQLTKEYLVS